MAVSNLTPSKNWFTCEQRVGSGLSGLEGLRPVDDIDKESTSWKLLEKRAHLTLKRCTRLVVQRHLM